MPQPAFVTPEDHSFHLIPRLTRKQSSKEISGEIKAPPLTPVPVEPLRYSAASVSLPFLANIERLEINETVQRNGVVYYVLEVYQYHYNSRLPTNINNPSRFSDASDAREPDFKVERRYSDFTKLRHQVRIWSCPNAQFLCPYCSEFGHYMRFRMRQPRLLVTLTSNVEKRKGILADFMADFVELAQNPLKNRIHRCEAHQHIPALIESFLKD